MKQIPLTKFHFIWHTVKPTTKALMSPIFVYFKSNNAEAEGNTFPSSHISSVQHLDAKNIK